MKILVCSQLEVAFWISMVCYDCSIMLPFGCTTSNRERESSDWSCWLIVLLQLLFHRLVILMIQLDTSCGSQFHRRVNNVQLHPIYKWGKRLHILLKPSSTLLRFITSSKILFFHVIIVVLMPVLSLKIYPWLIKRI